MNGKWGPGQIDLFLQSLTRTVDNHLLHCICRINDVAVG